MDEEYRLNLSLVNTVFKQYFWMIYIVRGSWLEMSFVVQGGTEIEDVPIL